MIAVRAFARYRSDARASAASVASDPDDEYRVWYPREQDRSDACASAASVASELDDEYRVWYQREARRNMTQINETVTRHRLRGASFYDDYEIRGAGAPFERLLFQTRNALDKMTEEPPMSGRIGTASGSVILSGWTSIASML